ncbi:hypothetical protein FOMA001_g8844 [Fusarium oxysporum f. sp. matthiolae]|nr:hypothetical protein FOMA001_g8844 [Fusarium oxysporum f. sp. matthiolae]
MTTEQSIISDAYPRDLSSDASEVESKLLSYGLKITKDIKSQESSFILEVLMASVRYKVPSVDLDDFRTALKERSSGEVVQIGSGLTSRVVHYVTKTEHEEVVAPGTAVALKVFTSTEVHTDSANISSRSDIATIMLREIKAFCHPILANHPNIAKLLFLGVQKNKPLPSLGIELGEHGSLDYLIRSKGPGLSKSNKIHVTLDIALGLLAVHQAGFGYGDLKPDNVILTHHPDHGRPIIAKLIDFGGISNKSGEYARPWHTTPLWSAPEVLSNDPDVDWDRADVYSYGLVVASLWARKDRGYGLSLLKKPSSCFLNDFVRISMAAEDLRDYLLIVKSQNDVVLMLWQQLDEIAMPQDEQHELMSLLTPILQASFWLRPDSLSLVDLLSRQAWSVGRQVIQESSLQSESVNENGKNESFENRAKSVKGEPAAISSNSFDHLVSIMKNPPSDVLNPVGYDMPVNLPEDTTPTRFLEHLYKSLSICVRETNIESQTNIESLSQFSQIFRLCDALYNTAVNRLGTPQKAIDVRKTHEWLCASARLASSSAICLATLLLNTSGVAPEILLPSRLFLVMLALSNSIWAMEVLSRHWPSHYRLVGQVIRERLPALGRAQVAFASEKWYLFLRFFYVYEHETNFNAHAMDLSTLAYIGAVDEFRTKIRELNASNHPDRHRLCHIVSYFTDKTSVSMARLAYEEGGRLDHLSQTYSAVLDSARIGPQGLPQLQNLSPISAAVMRGKTKLAMEFLRLHEEVKEPIVDFRETLKLSFTFLHHQLGDALLKSFRIDPKICQDVESETPSFEYILTTVLYEIVLSTGDRWPTGETFVRWAIHGQYHDENLEATIRSLIGHGAVFYRATTTSHSPVAIALFYDQVAFTKAFFENVKIQQWDPLELLRSSSIESSEMEDSIEFAAVTYCLFAKSDRCFNYLLDQYPGSVSAASLSGQDTLLHRACRFRRLEPVRSLLAAGASVLARNIAYHTPLADALLGGQIPIVDAVSSHCTDGQLEELLSPYGDSGGSIFSDLLEAWSKDRQPDLIDSIIWVIKHGGGHFYGSGRMPVWTHIVGKDRSSAYTDQLLDLEIMELLMDINEFSEGANTVRWRGLTLFQMAAWFCHVEIVKLLVSRGVDIDASLEFDPEAPRDEVFEWSQWIQSMAGLTLYDKMCIRSADPLLPNHIKAQGAIATANWVKDVDEILNILLDNNCKIADLRRINENMPAVTQKYAELIKASPLDSHGGRGESIRRSQENMAHAWPRPIALETSSDNGRNTESFHHLIEQVKSLRGYSPKERLKEKLGKEALEQALELLEHLISPRLHEDLQLELQICRFQWRLPPQWNLVGVTCFKGGGGHLVPLFQNTETNFLSTRKPGLYKPQSAAEHTATTLSQSKVSDKAGPLHEVDSCDGRTNEQPSTMSAREELYAELGMGKKSHQTCTPEMSGPANAMREHSDHDTHPLCSSSLKDFIQAPPSHSRDSIYTNADGNNALHVAVALNYLPGLRAMHMSPYFESLCRQKNENGLKPIELAQTYGNLEAESLLQGAYTVF